MKTETEIESDEAYEAETGLSHISQFGINRETNGLY